LTIYEALVVHPYSCPFRDSVGSRGSEGRRGARSPERLPGTAAVHPSASPALRMTARTDAIVGL